MQFLSFISVRKTIAKILLGVFFFQSFASVGSAAWWDIFTKKQFTAPEVVRTRLVSLYVEEALWKDSELKNKIKQYANNVQRRIKGRVILIAVPPEVSPSEIFETNAQLYFL